MGERQKAYTRRDTTFFKNENSPRTSTMTKKSNQETKAEQNHELLVKYQEKLFLRFKDYILGMALLQNRPPNELPPELQEQAQEHYNAEALPTLILLDDSDTTIHSHHWEQPSTRVG